MFEINVFLYIGLMALIAFLIYCFTDLSDEYGRTNNGVWYKRIKWGDNLFGAILISIIIAIIHFLFTIT